VITTTHIILNTALLGSKKHPERNWPLILGSIVPDTPMIFYFFMMVFFKGRWETMRHSLNEYHFRLLWVDWLHSIPLAVAGLLICALLKHGPAAYFFAAMALHDLEDLPLHAAIVHRHFLPFSNYAFHSPISYWEPQYHANIVAPLEWLSVIICSYFLWKRNLHPFAQIALLIVIIFQGALLLYLGGIHW